VEIGTPVGFAQSPTSAVTPWPGVAWAGLAVITAPETTRLARKTLIKPRIPLPSVTAT
jgi:hypothetical protein